MPNPTRSEQIEHLLQLLESCPTACQVVFKNPALPSGIVVHIPPAEPTPAASGDPQPSPVDAGVPAAPHR
jgi:hypothetical protein